MSKQQPSSFCPCFPIPQRNKPNKVQPQSPKPLPNIRNDSVESPATAYSPSGPKASPKSPEISSWNKAPSPVLSGLKQLSPTPLKLR